jgi:hypothetical protein
VSGLITLGEVVLAFLATSALLIVLMRVLMPARSSKKGFRQ